MLGEAKIQSICEQVLQRCGRDQAQVLVASTGEALTRFANNSIHQNVAESDTTLIVRYILGLRQGTATTNRLDSQAMDEVVEKARQYAVSSPEDPGFPGLAEPAAYQAAACFDPDTAGYSPENRAQAVKIVCSQAQGRGLKAFGAFSTGTDELAVANSRQLFAYHVSTHANFLTRVMTDNSAGHAEAAGWRGGEIPVEELGGEAMMKASQGHAPRAVEPGEYTVILDPYATQDLLQMLNFHGMSAQTVLEGRSWMSERLGKQAMSPQVNIWDNGLDPQGLPMPFDYEGVPKQRVDIVKDGVVTSPVCDLQTGKESGKASTGHGLPPMYRGFRPLATNLFLGAGAASLPEMIASTPRGLYITRFWYTRLVHPRDCVITGMTRDGVFMIENGQVAYPVKNLRFTQSYVEALNRVEALGKEARLLSSDFGGTVVRAPAIKIGAFNFTGVTV